CRGGRVGPWTASTSPGAAVSATSLATTTPRAARSRRARSTSAGSLTAGQPGIELLVARPGRGHHVVRDGRARRLAVPVEAGRPVPEELLVQRGLRPARRPLRRRPEP